MKNYKNQILQTCIQTYFNLYGVMPGAQELKEMLGEDNPIVVPVAAAIKSIKNEEPAA